MTNKKEIAELITEIEHITEDVLAVKLQILTILTELDLIIEKLAGTETSEGLNKLSPYCVSE